MAKLRKVTHIVLHHNGVEGRTAEDIRHYHTAPKKPHGKGGRGWRDIGYHYVVEETGLVVKGRSRDQWGAHAEGANGCTIGVCWIGNGNKGLPNTQQVAALETLLASLCFDYGLPASAVIGHREVPAHVKGAKPTRKLCPGKLVNMDYLRARVAEVLGKHGEAVA